MEKHYITINGQKYRVEFNLNSMALFEEIIGIDYGQFTELAMNNKITVRMIRALAYVAIKEGERCDGREFNVSELDFGSMFNMQNIEQLMAIYQAQGTGEKKSSVMQAKATAMKRKMSIFRRSK